ncbi:MAG: hypothetical protein ACOY3Z_07885 [Thermodesulfobacteriota bacterium]
MKQLSSRWTVLILLLVVLALVIRENLTKRPASLPQLVNGQVELCLSCHKDEQLDPAHGREILGCSSCHLGDPLAIDKAGGHRGMVKNPGDLRVVEKTCGVEGCHAQDVGKVKNSLMATNRGILATLLHYWGEAPDQHGDFSVEELITTGKTSLAIDYYRKLCATCHLWKEKGDMEGFFGEKGGGCTACHYTRPQAPQAERPWETFLRFGKEKRKPHPLIVKKVPMESCIRCHNRSGRVGTSYIGVYEGENYGTPYEQGGPSKKELPGDRFYLELPDDIHHKQGMACIDCHVRDELMGDGKRHAHYEQALEISCKSCHTNGEPGITRKNKEMNNIKAGPDGKPVLVGKLDGKTRPLNPPKAGVCDSKGHQRLGCESCHSAWIPQCYGCHAKRDMRETHLDKLTGKETQGWWQEGRSYLRYEKPMLAVWKDKVVTVTPGCQDIVTLIDEKGQPAGGFNRLTMAALNPHTTQKAGRTCADCHTSTKTMGLGEGTAWRENGQWRFNRIDQGVDTPAGLTPPLDGYVDINGQPLQKSARPDLRPFNQEELGRILRVGQCLPCHKNYNDKVFREYDPKNQCPVFDEESGLNRREAGKR